MHVVVQLFVPLVQFFSAGTEYIELVQNSLNWYNFNCTGLFLSTVKKRDFPFLGV